jgi:hypothetical protein
VALLAVPRVGASTPLPADLVAARSTVTREHLAACVGT